jgi:hypothetical protein
VTTGARIALGIALGALLASLPFLHYRAAGRHDHGPATHPSGGDHAHHTH